MSTSKGEYLIGKVLGSCLLEKLLGYGGSSAVFLAQQHDPERKVAVKVFLPRSTMDVSVQKNFYNRFLGEAEAASALDHPNILPILSYGEQHGLPYIIMPYMSGGTLHECISKQGQLSLNEAQEYLQQIASALDYAHMHGCIHCDVKPANILLTDDGHVMLSDFGIARMLFTGEGSKMQPDAAVGPTPGKPAELLIGTPDFFSPEQALGQPLDGRSDIYSLGIILFYLLAGRLPFKADSTIAMALLQVQETPPSLSQLRADISPYIESVIRKALAKRPENRFQTAGEFSAAFAQSITVSSKVYHINPKEKPPLLQDHSSMNAIDNPEPAIPRAFPFVRTRPAWQRTFAFPRILLAAFMLFVVGVGGVFAISLISSHSANNIPRGGNSAQPGGNDLFGDDLGNSADWPTSNSFFFVNQQYHMRNTSAHYAALALFANHQFSDFRLTITTFESQGTRDGADYYGVVFRSASDQSRYYLFEVVAWDGGQYMFSRIDGDGHWNELASGPAPSLLAEVGNNNTITIDANGNTFNFLINSKPVGSSITDFSKSGLFIGEVGLYVEEQGTELVFSNMKIGPR